MILKPLVGLLFLVMGWPAFIYGQDKNFSLNPDSIFYEKGEVFFTFQVASPREIAVLSSVVSIDKVNGFTLHAYANRKEFDRFISMGYSPSIIEKIIPSDLMMKDIEAIRQVNDWDYYPTYTAYLEMMLQFEEMYPDLCQIETIGTLPSGRKLLAAKISDHVDLQEGEPQFLYTSSMHGNETAGYVLMLRLIDYLLTHYSTDPDITWLVDHIEIWINPLANPDGTYAGGNNTVAGATRYNANFVDLNRNYPDPEDGPHPDGNSWQPETMAFMELASTHDFVMGANFHSGTELVNYPWDTWAQRHADDNWWQYVAYEYVDTVHFYSDGYFYGEGDGVTNGYDWYTISGGRQDYMTYFHHGRECTIELSDEYIYPASQLPVIWEYNYRSFLNYLGQCSFGITGLITDSISGNPLRAKVLIENHDIDSSHVYSVLPAGNFHRLLYEGDYDLEIKSPGYFPKSIHGIIVSNQQPTFLSVEMVPGELIADFYTSDRSIPAGGTVQFIDESYGVIQSWLWAFDGGIPASSTVQNPQVAYQEPGIYPVSLTVSDGINSNTIIRTGYIRVSVEFTMQNGEYSTCSCLFYDSGGESGNYSNNQNLVMTFTPEQQGEMLTADFIFLNIEDDPSCAYDWLRIYDGIGTTSPMIGEYCGTQSPGKITATNDDGALTFQFHSDNYITAPGWIAEISCDVNAWDDRFDNPDSRIILFPNPADELITVRYEQPLKGTVYYRLFSVTGNIILTEEADGSSVKQIDTRGLGRGVYYLEILWDQGRLFKKLILY